MKNVGELLRDADPLRDESLASPDQRNLQRKAVLAAASSIHAREGSESRRWITLLATAVLIVIAVSFLAARLWSPHVGNVEAAIRFEVRLAEDKPAAGLREAKILGTDRSIYLHDGVIVTNDDIASAQIIRVGGESRHYNVGIEFNASGAEKMRNATGKHIGKPVAILLDGQVVLAPVLRSPIGGSAVITGSLTKAQAEKIVSGITVR